MDAIFITARLKSTRLPRKVLLNVENKPIIQYLIDRLKKNISNKNIIICTSTNVQDNDLEDISKKNKINIFRGSEEDVLDRYYQCAIKHKVKNFYIIYGDEPFIDMKVLQKTFKQLKTHKEKLFVDNSSLIDGTFGYGFNYDAIKFVNLNKTSNENEVWGRMVSNMDLKIIRNRYKNFPHEPKKIRLTIDYPEDLIMFSTLIKYIGNKYNELSIKEISDLYNSLRLYEINLHRSKDYIERINKQETNN